MPTVHQKWGAEKSTNFKLLGIKGDDVLKMNCKIRKSLTIQMKKKELKDILLIECLNGVMKNEGKILPIKINQ